MLGSLVEKIGQTVALEWFRNVQLLITLHMNEPFIQEE